MSRRGCWKSRGLLRHVQRVHALRHHLEQARVFEIGEQRLVERAHEFCGVAGAAKVGDGDRRLARRLTILIRIVLRREDSQAASRRRLQTRADSLQSSLQFETRIRYPALIAVEAGGQRRKWRRVDNGALRRIVEREIAAALRDSTDIVAIDPSRRMRESRRSPAARCGCADHVAGVPVLRDPLRSRSSIDSRTDRRRASRCPTPTPPDPVCPIIGDTSACPRVL